MKLRLLLTFSLTVLWRKATAQLIQQIPSVQVKISDTPFPVANAQQLGQIVWTNLGGTGRESVYCVSEAPVSQLRFMCIDCLQKNITDMVQTLNAAQDLTRSAGFPTVALRDIPVNTNWTGATLVCQAALNGQLIDSAPTTVDVRFLKQPHVVDQGGQGPVLIPNQGYRFYVECVRGADGMCQGSGRRKTLKCSVQSHRPANTFRWLKNGVVTSGNGAEITIGPEMIGQSIQCSANNGLFSDSDMPTSQAVQIDPYTAARVVQENFQNVQSSAPFQSGSRIEVNSQVNLGCQVEGNPRPVVFWKLRRTNGQVVDAACPQGFEGSYQEVAQDTRSGLNTNIVRLNALCTLRIANYSFSGQYWCSACSYVSQGSPECSPSLEAPGASTLTVQVQGPPMQSDAPPSIEQPPHSNNAVVSVHYCSEPAPNPPREITFQIDQNDIQTGQNWENFRFEGFNQNNTVPNCYFARLSVNPVRDADQYRQITLKVQNQYGTKQIPVSLESLLGGGSSSSGRLSGWWIAFIVFISICVFLAAIVSICVRKQLFCFNKVKQPHDTYGETKAKASLNASPDGRLYGEDPTIPRMYSASPAEKRLSPSFHEGLNYAELRLADGSVQPVREPSVAPSINSVV